MSDLPRKVKFNSADDAISEVLHLRGGCRQLRNWNLPMMAHHCATVMESFTTPPENPVPTPEQAAKKAGFVDVVLARGGPPPGITPPPHTIPTLECGEADIERLINALRKMQNYPHPLVSMGPFGPVPIEEVRQLHLLHLAHHLNFLIPTSV